MKDHWLFLIYAKATSQPCTEIQTRDDLDLNIELGLIWKKSFQQLLKTFLLQVTLRRVLGCRRRLWVRHAFLSTAAEGDTDPDGLGREW